MPHADLWSQATQGGFQLYSVLCTESMYNIVCTAYSYLAHSVLNVVIGIKVHENMCVERGRERKREKRINKINTSRKTYK